MILEPPQKSPAIDMERVRKNPFRIYAYVFFQTFLVLIPVIVPYWQTKGLTVKDVFALQAIFGAALIAFDAPAGYVADMFGRKGTMIVGSVITALGFQVLWFGSTFFEFAVYEVVLGLGLSLQSGCDVALLYNSLEKMELGSRKASYLGRRLTAMTVGEGVASLLGGVLASVSLQLPAQVNAVTAWITVLCAMLIYEPPGQMLPRGSHIENFRMIRRALFGHSRMLTLAILSFIFYGFATYCAVWIFQPYWASRGFAVSTFGYLWAANCFATALVARFAHAIEEKIGSIAIVFIIALLPIIGYMGMGFVGGAFGLVFALAFPLCRGLNQVLFQDAINTRVPPEMRAVTNSVGSLGMRSLFIGFGPLVGAFLDRHGPDQTLVLLGCVYAAGFFFVALPLLSQRQHFKMD